MSPSLILTDWLVKEHQRHFGCAGQLAALVAVLVLPDVNTDVETTSSLRDLPRLVRADIRIVSVGAVNFTVRFLFAGVLLSTVVLYAQEYEITIGILSDTGVSGVVMAVSVLGASVTTLLVSRYSDQLSNRVSSYRP